LKPNLKTPSFDTRLWEPFRNCPGRRVSIAYVNLQQGYVMLSREGITKTKEDGSKNLQFLDAFSIPGDTSCQLTNSMYARKGKALLLRGNSAHSQFVIA